MWFFSILAFLLIFLFLFCFFFLSLLCPKPSLAFVKWKWQKKGENVWKGNTWVLLSNKGREGEAGTSVLHIKILGFNRHKRWSFKEDPKYSVNVSASKRNHLRVFSPPKLWLKYLGCCFPENENTKLLGFFLVQKERLRSGLKLAVVCQVQLWGLWA